MNVPIALGSALNTFPTAGIKFPNSQVVVVVTSPFMDAPTFCPRAILPMQLLAAAFMALKDPDSVVFASSADVPVSFISFWITWIALLLYVIRFS